jgi:histidyl-tRNA synthetase
MGTEALGCKDATLDAETIQMVSHFCKKLGIEDVRILLNSIGCKECKQDYIRRLLSFLEEKKPPLCTQCRGRKNPLRVLDCKVCSKKMKDAPFPTQTLCNACMQHFEEVKDYLHLFGVMYEIQPHLVRGLDYYTRTCFEVIDPRLGAKNAIAAGGRYDDLVQELGGPPTPCFGFAAGVERIILSLKQREILFTEDECTVYLAPAGGVTNKEIASLLQRLRKDGVKCICDWEKLSLRSHLRLAQKMQVDYVIIVGEEELQKEVFALRCMKEGEQFLVSYEELLKKIAHV